MYAKNIRPSLEREARRLNRAPQARSNLRAKRAGRDENVPEKWADFFYCTDFSAADVSVDDECLIYK